MLKKRWIYRILPALFLCFCTLFWYHAGMAQTSSTSDAASVPQSFRFVREAGGIREYVLKSNGLRVLVKEDFSAPVATVMLTYLVGSRHETERFRGGAHLLEHMMFKGTPHYRKSEGTAIPRVLQRTGALLNASTWKDGTNYYETLPVDKLDLALDIEAERMRQSLFKAEDLVSEMPVVQSEFDRMENSPLVALDLAVWSEAFQKHTYHHPIIGIREDLEKMPIESLRAFYDSFYWPDNAVLAVIGSLPANEILKKIETKFASVPSSEGKIPKLDLTEPAQKETRFVEVKREDPVEAVMIGHKAPEADHDDSVPLDVLSFILSRGKTSRLYRSLVDRSLAVDVYTYHSKSHDPGLYVTEAILTTHARHDDVSKIILNIYDDVVQNGVLEEEVQRAKNQLHAEVAFSRDGSYSVASQLSRAIAAGDWSLFPLYLERLEAVTPADLHRVAKKYLRPETMTLGNLISKNPQVAEAKQPAKSVEPVPPQPFAPASGIPDDLERAPKAGAVVPGAEPVRRGALAGRVKQATAAGIQVTAAPMEIEDVVTLMGSFEGAGLAYAPNPIIAQLTVALLDEGTQSRDKFEIARLLENRGASISFQIDHERVGFHARCLREDVPLILQLVAEQLREPRFDPEEFRKQVDQQKVLILQEVNNTASRAQGELSRSIYPENHPNYEPDFDKQLADLEKLTLEDVKTYHRNVFGPRQMRIVGAGDISFDVLRQNVEEHFAGWKVPEHHVELVKKTGLKKEPRQKTIFLPDKVKVDVFFGHALPITRLNDDYLAVFLANNILGGDFSARLAMTVRDDQGLTYAVHSEVHGIDRDVEGDWQINIILNAKVLDKGIAATREQIVRFVEKGITAEELQDKQETAAGKFQVSLSTSGGLAHRILRHEELQLGVEYLDRYPDLVRAVTLEEANAVIRRYFHPDHLHVIISGTVRENESASSSV